MTGVRYGECPECRLYFAVRNDGTVRHHKGRDLRPDGGYNHCCPGEGQLPLAIWVES